MYGLCRSDPQPGKQTVEQATAADQQENKARH
jgi:hypothetical protein